MLMSEVLGQNLKQFSQLLEKLGPMKRKQLAQKESMTVMMPPVLTTT